MGVLFVCKVVFRTVFVLINNVYIFPPYVVWMLLLQPLRRLRPDLYWRLEGVLYHWMISMVTMWVWSGGYDVVEVGDDIRQCQDERTLVIANHQSTSDAPMLMVAFNPRPNMLPNTMWIMDYIFRYTNFGVVSAMHEDFFIRSGREYRDTAVLELKKHIRDSYVPRDRKFMVLFPEGGFLKNRRESSQTYALKNNLPVLTHVSLPRLGAVQGIVDVCGYRSNRNTDLQRRRRSDSVSPTDAETEDEQDAERSKEKLSGKTVTSNTSEVEVKADCQLRWVLDVTICYQDAKPLDIPTVASGWRDPCRTFLFYRLYPAAQVPTEPEGLTQWLFARWQEKEHILATFYSTGKVPVDQYCTAPAPPQTVLQDPLRFFLLHLFFLTSSYVHLRMFTFLLGVIW